MGKRVDRFRLIPYTTFMEPVFTISSIWSTAWEKTKAHIGFLVGVTLVVGILQIIPSAVSALTEEEYPDISFVFNLIAFIMSIWIGAGILDVVLKVFNDQPASISDLFKQHKLIAKYFLLSLVTGLLTLVGFVFLIIPGIILSLMFMFSSWYLVDQRLPIFESMQASIKATKGLKWKLLILGLIVCGINLLGALALGVGLLVSVPLSWMLLVTAYKMADARVS